MVEVADVLRPDFVCFDAQHGDADGVLSATSFTALEGFGVGGLVRVAKNEPESIGRFLDMGAHGVMVPMVNDAKDAERAVGACRYAPSGTRSFGMRTPRIDSMSDGYQPVCAVQIETVEAVENVREIAAVDGVDWLYVGPADLGLSMGGSPGNDVISIFSGSHPLAAQLLDAFDRVVAAGEAHGVLPGLHCGSGQATKIAESHGFRVAAVATDSTEMIAGMARQLANARN